MSRKIKRLKWTPETAQSEFGRDAETIAKRIKTAGIEGAKDGTFSTAQICAALFGDLESAKLRTALALASQEERRDRREARELLDAAAVVAVWSGYLTHVRQVIRHCRDLSEARKREILSQLKEIPPEEFFKQPKAEE